MNQFKRAQVIMLPTKEKSILQLNVIHNYLFSINNGANIPSQPYQHVYIISDDEIKEGDWYLFENKIYKCTGDWAGKKQYQLNALKYDFHKGEYCKKIIATTDTSLKIHKSIIAYADNRSRTFYGDELLPQPSQQFIEKYIESYNKGEIITDVLVEYELEDINIHRFEDILKINSKDNTITIKKLKDSWSREEVIELLTKLSLTTIYSKNDIHCWIKENL